MKSLDKLVKSFLEGDVLTGEELNLIVAYINNTVDYINNTIKPALENIPTVINGTNGKDGLVGAAGIAGISSINSFVGAVDINAALTKLGDRNLTNYPPTNYFISSNAPLEENEVLFITSARKLGEDWLFGDDGYIWSIPVLLGFNTTSTTGTDNDLFNYIYCRTKKGHSASSYYPSNTLLLKNILEYIENNPGKGIKVEENTISPVTNIENASFNTLEGMWTDHPYGIDENLPHEWMIGYLKNEEEEWEYYFGPIMISNYGFNGLDGDGLEYIFTLRKENDPPTLTPPYSGKVQDSLYTGVIVDSKEYLNDDFIPVGWYDEPLEPSLENSIQYVSIRKRTGNLEANSSWGAFTTPKIWNTYITAGFNMLLSNDNFIIAYKDSNDEIKKASYTKIQLANGSNDITANITDYDIRLNISVSNNLDSYLGISAVSHVSTQDGTVNLIYSGGNITNIINSEIDFHQIVNNNDQAILCLYKLNNNELPLLKGSIQYTINIYPKGSYNLGAIPSVVLSKTLNIQIINTSVSNSVIYMLETDFSELHYSLNFANNIIWKPSSINLRLKRISGEQTDILNNIPNGMSVYKLFDDNTEISTTLGELSNIAINENNISEKVVFKLYNSSDNNGTVISLTAISVHRDYLRMLIPSGTYENKRYEITDRTVPLVYLEQNQKYYYLIRENNELETGVFTAPGNNNVWAEATEYKVLLTEAIFANFAKLGSFVIYDKYFFSQFGYVIDSSGNIIYKDSTSNVSSYYLYFDPNDPMGETLPSSGNYKFRPMKVINAESGEEWMAGGNLYIDTEGRANFKGTVLADNLYRKVAFTWGGSSGIFTRLLKTGSTLKVSSGNSFVKDSSIWLYINKGKGYVEELLSTWGNGTMTKNTLQAITENWNNLSLNDREDIEEDYDLSTSLLTILTESYRKIETEDTDTGLIINKYNLTSGTYFELTLEIYDELHPYQYNGETLYENYHDQWDALIQDDDEFVFTCTYNADTVVAIGLEHLSSGDHLVYLPRAVDFPGKLVEISNVRKKSNGGVRILIKPVDKVLMAYYPVLSKGGVNSGGNTNFKIQNTVYPATNVISYYSLGAEERILFCSDGTLWIVLSDDDGSVKGATTSFHIDGNTYWFTEGILREVTSHS